MTQDNDTMKLYMQNIGQFPLITTEQEVKLAARIKKGDEEARAMLIRSNLRLVVKIAHDFKGLGLPLLDLISEGNIGLMRAVEKFDPSKGAKLSSYAAWWIKQSMRRALANQARTIRIPVQSASKMSKIQAARQKLLEQLGREPTDKEIAHEVNLTERTVTGLRIGKTTTISLQAPIQHGEEGEFRDIIPDEKSTAPDEVVQDEETMTYMLRLIKRLDEREQTILNLRFGLSGGHPKTLEEVSQTIGRTRERVRQIQNQALDKLKQMLAEDGMGNNLAGEGGSLFQPIDDYDDYEGISFGDLPVDFEAAEAADIERAAERKARILAEEEEQKAMKAKNKHKGNKPQTDSSSDIDLDKLLALNALKHKARKLEEQKKLEEELTEQEEDELALKAALEEEAKAKKAEEKKKPAPKKPEPPKKPAPKKPEPPKKPAPKKPAPKKPAPKKPEPPKKPAPKKPESPKKPAPKKPEPPKKPTPKKPEPPKKPAPKKPEPPKKPAPKKPEPKKPTPKKPEPPKKPAPKKPDPKKPAPKKPEPKKPDVKPRSGGKNTAVGKVSAKGANGTHGVNAKVVAQKKPAPKAPTPKKPASKKPVPKAPAPKKPVPKAPAPKKPVPKKPAPKAPAPKKPAPKAHAPKKPAPKKRR